MSCILHPAPYATGTPSEAGSGHLQSTQSDSNDHLVITLKFIVHVDWRHCVDNSPGFSQSEIDSQLSAR